MHSGRDHGRTLKAGRPYSSHHARSRPTAKARPRAACPRAMGQSLATRSEEHTSELQSLMRISYAVFCLKKNNILHIPQAIYITNPHQQSNTFNQTLHTSYD